jgi:putative ABC transport system permease protein
MAGIAITYAALPLLLSAGAEALPRLSDISVDVRVLLIATSTSMFTAAVFGLTPALHAIRRARHWMLSPAGGGVGVGRDALRTHRALIAAEVALALTVMIGAGLFLRSFRELQSVDVGFDAERVLAAEISLPGSRYGEPALVHAFYDQLIERLQAMSGVESASIGAYLPLHGEGPITSLTHAGRLQAGVEERLATLQRIVRADFFATMGIPLLLGRTFDERDDLAVARQLIVSRSLAEAFWPGEDPIGKRVTSSLEPDEEDWREIIGVVADVRYVGLDAPQQPQIYESHFERPARDMSVVVLSDLDAGTFAARLSETVHALDPRVPVDGFRSMQEVARDALAEPRFSALVFAVLALTALALSCSGTYAVVSFAISRQAAEIGVRMALGSSRSAVFRRVLWQGMAPVVLGVVLGIATSVAISGLAAGVLYGVRPFDPSTYAGVVAVVAVVALLACWLPSRRAANVDPLVAIRGD